MVMKFRARVQKQGERLKVELPLAIRMNFKPGDIVIFTITKI